MERKSCLTKTDTPILEKVPGLSAFHSHLTRIQFFYGSPDFLSSFSPTVFRPPDAQCLLGDTCKSARVIIEPAARQGSPRYPGFHNRLKNRPNSQNHACPRLLGCQKIQIFQLFRLARPKRFELLTPRFVVWCSIQLSYGRALTAWPVFGLINRSLRQKQDIGF